MVSRPMTRQTVAAAWLDGLAPVLDRLAVEICGQLGREPDAGDLLLALACAPATLPAQALAELGVELDVLWGTIERLRQQAARAREQLTEQIREVRAAKEQALTEQAFGAAGLRDQERELTEQKHARTDLAPEVLQEITRRLGIRKRRPAATARADLNGRAGGCGSRWRSPQPLRAPDARRACFIHSRILVVFSVCATVPASTRPFLSLS